MIMYNWHHTSWSAREPVLSWSPHYICTRAFWMFHGVWIYAAGLCFKNVCISLCTFKHCYCIQLESDNRSLTMKFQQDVLEFFQIRWHQRHNFRDKEFGSSVGWKLMAKRTACAQHIVWMCSARSRPFYLSLGTVTGERVPVTINGEPVEFDAPGFKGAHLTCLHHIE